LARPSASYQQSFTAYIPQLSTIACGILFQTAASHYGAAMELCVHDKTTQNATAADINRAIQTLRYSDLPETAQK